MVSKYHILSNNPLILQYHFFLEELMQNVEETFKTIKKDKKIMLFTAIVFPTCVIGTLNVSAHWIAACFAVNSLLSVYLAFKMD